MSGARVCGREWSGGWLGDAQLGRVTPTTDCEWMARKCAARPLQRVATCAQAAPQGRQTGRQGAAGLHGCGNDAGRGPGHKRS